MALRQKLTKPFVVEPQDGSPHTHTVVFLHRFPESTTDEELPTKVLSTKRTSRNHETLQTQFPTVRWVFPFAKNGPRPYGNLTAEDKAAVGLTNSATPYITQVLLQEAQRVEGGLERVILGGQGETAVAGHDAMLSFPEVPAPIRGNPDDIAEFLHKTFNVGHWTDAGSHPRLAGYVGMHAEDTEVTRDVTTYRTATMRISTAVAGAVPRVNKSIVLNTPHRFIHGGYKVHNAKWDGRRIDDFAKFLAEDLSVYRVADEAQPAPNANDKKLSASAEASKHEMNERDKYLSALAAEKKANEDRAKIIKMRIEADKQERKYRQQRERESRIWADTTAAREKVAKNTRKAKSTSPKGRSNIRRVDWQRGRVLGERPDATAAQREGSATDLIADENYMACDDDDEELGFLHHDEEEDMDQDGHVKDGHMEKRQDGDDSSHSSID